MVGGGTVSPLYTLLTVEWIHADDRVSVMFLEERSSGLLENQNIIHACIHAPSMPHPPNSFHALHHDWTSTPVTRGKKASGTVRYSTVWTLLMW